MTHLLKLNTFLLILFLPTVPLMAQNPSHLVWHEYVSDHYKVYYPEGQEFTASKSLEVAEAVHEKLVALYGPVDSKISIVIKDDEDYANGGAYYLDNKIEIYATSLDFDQRSYTDWLWNVVTHELTHIYSMHQSMKTTRKIPMAYYQQIDYQEEKREDVLVGYPNILVSYPIPIFNVPGWLAEGVAQNQTRNARFDCWDAHRDMILRQAALNDKLLTIDEMAVFNWNGIGNEMVYNHGYALVRYISEHYGEEKVAEIMRALSSTTTMTFNSACKRVLNKSAEELYDEWKISLKNHYDEVKLSLGELVEGTPFRTGGYINAFPVWSPDGSRLAYVSNKGQDYSIQVCFIANLKDGGWRWKGKEKEEKKLGEKLEKQKNENGNPDETKKGELEAAGSFDIALAGGIQSAPIWLDEWNLLYNRRMPSNKHGSHWWDMYRYIINTKDPRKGTETRITESLRGTYPNLSYDKSKLVFVKNESGFNNLFILNRDDNSQKQLTFYNDGTRLYRPRWSPDGSRIAYTIHQGDAVNIAIINPDGTGFSYVVSSAGQDRDPAWTSNGRELLFSSDVTGIANIYRIDLRDNTVSKLTNVIGGAYSPEPSPADTTLAFSYFGPDGYEIRLMPLIKGTPVEDSDIFRKPVTKINHTSKTVFDVSSSKPVGMKTLDFSLMPVVKNDRGNMKFGSYITKSDVADRGSFLFSGAISPTNKDTDLYALFEYKKFIPTVFVEMIRLTRSVDKTENFMEEYGDIIKKRTYDLNEIDLGMRYAYKDRHLLEGRLIYSQYNARLEYTYYLTGPMVYKPYYTYSRGFDLGLTYSFEKYNRTRDEEINPRGGRKVLFRYDRMMNFFLDDFENVGFLIEKYKRYPYDQFYLNWIEWLPVPGTKKHTFQLRGQLNLIDRYVDDFYELQLGGPTQMRGYTFYSLSGRKTVMGQALYRFPIVYDMRKRFFVWYFNHIYGGVYADVGRAWNERNLNWSTKGFVRDVGVELRFHSITYYMFPTMIQLSAAYGPDNTWIKKFDEETSTFKTIKDDQNPWKFYCTVLFGFF